MSLINRLKLAKMLMKFAEIETDNGTLIYEGEMGEGLEVFIEEDGQLLPAPNGEYRTEDKVITIEDGKITAIEEIKVEEEPQNEPIEMEDERVAELEAEIEVLKKEIEDKDARIAELEAQLAEKEEQLKMSVEKPAHIEVKNTIKNKDNKALRYFEQ
jgi:hypothetical protein